MVSPGHDISASLSCPWLAGRSSCEKRAWRAALMPTLYVSGDLFDNAHDAQAFAQGCNCQGSMGAGIAKTFRARYPEMHDEYRRRCKAQPRQFNLGDCWLWKADSQPWVFNLGTQEGYWRREGRCLGASRDRWGVRW